MRRRGLLVGALLVTGLFSGAIREFMFVNLNYQLDHVGRGTPASYAHSMFQVWVHGWSLHSLVILKWALASCFILLMWAMSILLLKMHDATARLLRPITLMFLGVGAGALLMHLLSGHWPLLEEPAVNMLHALQYPMLLFFLWAALVFYPSRPTHQNHH